MNRRALIICGLLLAIAAPFSNAISAGGGEIHDEATQLLGQERWEDAAALLREHLGHTSDDAQGHALLGRALLSLKERDEAAHHLAAAVRIYEAQGDKRNSANARRDLAKADGLNGRRERLRRDLTSKLYKSAEQLSESGHPERALEILNRILPVATGKDAAKVTKLREQVRAAFEEVDLDKAGEERGEEGIWPLITYESKHYVLKANLEEKLTKLVADTMDDVHNFYVLVYFDGDEKAAKGAKATIRIHPDRETMLGNWQGGSAPEGWWSPGENQVTCYDTRTTRGNLDWMLETLFHEASHQFMTLLNQRGGNAPAWLNEGTASFFEGTTAMADGRVLWPDAAIGRLQNLAAMLEGNGEPGVIEVIGYSQPGSYPGNYYAWGWGLAYFMQQYEDPETLEYVYRPLYARYRSTITSRGGDSMALFKEVFLGEDSPLEHETLSDFDKDWQRWILRRIKPLHISNKPERRTLRKSLVERYLDAAAKATDDKKAPVSERELLERALGHIEYIRTRIDGEEHPDVVMISLQADIFERLERPEAAAPLVQTLLDLADDGIWAPSDEEYEAFEKRLKGLDRKNWALRRAQSAKRTLARTSRKLLEEYLEADEPMPLRAYTFAATFGAALADKDGLLPAAVELRSEVRELGLLAGEVHALFAPRKEWMTIYNSKAKNFELAPRFISLESVRPVGYLNTSFELGDEYEVRATFRRDGEMYSSTCHGVVIAGVKEGDWLVFGLLKSGKAGLWRMKLSGGGGVTTKKIETFYLDPPPEDGEDLSVRVHVTDGRTLEIRVGDCEPIESALPDDLPDGRFAGIYVKDGETRLESPVVEIYP